MKQDEIIEMVKQAGLDWQQGWTLDDDQPNRFEAFAKLVAAKEREVCADLCATFYDEMWEEYAEAGNELAEIIRARGEA